MGVVEKRVSTTPLCFKCGGHYSLLSIQAVFSKELVRQASKRTLG